MYTTERRAVGVRGVSGLITQAVRYVSWGSHSSHFLPCPWKWMTLGGFFIQLTHKPTCWGPICLCEQPSKRIEFSCWAVPLYRGGYCAWASAIRIFVVENQTNTFGPRSSLADGLREKSDRLFTASGASPVSVLRTRDQINGQIRWSDRE